jgi:high-affinity nickel-transport protein
MASFSSLRTRLAGIYTLLIVCNVAVWMWALLIFRDHPILLGTALLAYSFGLRHAVDADHIAAIDNVTRTLMQDGKRSVSVGFWLAVGHSTVVIGLALAIAVTSMEISSHTDTLKGLGGIVGTSVSAVFLFLIAAMNGFILADVCAAFRRVRAGGAFSEQDFDLLLNNRGFLARLFRPLFPLVSRS